MLFESGAPMWFWKKWKLFESDATRLLECEAPMLFACDAWKSKFNFLTDSIISFESYAWK